jgi:hypothetical protein
MKKLLQWLAVAVFACLVFIPGIAQAQPTSTPATDYYGALDRFLGVLIGGFLAFSGMYLNRKRD